MQNPFSPLTWTEVFRGLIFTSIGLIPYIVKVYQERKKSDLDNSETSARTALAQANARSVELHDNIASGEAIEKFMLALIKSGDTIQDLQSKIFRLEQERIGYDMLQLDVKKAVALLAYHNIPFHTAEHPDVKVLIAKMVDVREDR